MTKSILRQPDKIQMNIGQANDDILFTKPTPMLHVPESTAAPGFWRKRIPSLW